MGILCLDEHLDYQRSPVKLIYYPREINRIPAHWHNNLELNYVDSGTVTILENGQLHTLLPNQIRFINSGAVHKISAKGALGLTVVFSHSFLCQMSPEAENLLFDWDSCPEMQGALKDAVLPLYRISQQLYLEGRPADDDSFYEYLFINGCLYNIAYLMMRYFQAQPENRSKYQPTQGSHHIGQAVGYIEAHYQSDIAAGEVAKYVGVSREYFSRMFHYFTGSTFTQYLTSLRLAVAYRQLVTTRQPILDIALNAGFPDVRAFARHFKVQYGCPPGEYRKLHSQRLDITN